MPAHIHTYVHSHTHTLTHTGITDVLSWWTFTDIFEEGGFPKSEFENVYGAMTMHGVPKPVWQVYVK